VRESTHGVDVLDGDIELRRAILLSRFGQARLANAVDFLVDLRAMVIAFLTSASNGELHTRWMPSANTSDLAETLVCLSWEFLCVPTAGDTLETLSLGDADAIDHLVLVEDAVEGDLLLEVLLGPVDFLGNSSAINLDFHDVGFLVDNSNLSNLSVCNNSNNSSVLLELSNFSFNKRFVFHVSFGVLCEGLLLRLEPVLIKSTSNFIR